MIDDQELDASPPTVHELVNELSNVCFPADMRAGTSYPLYLCLLFCLGIDRDERFTCRIRPDRVVVTSVQSDAKLIGTKGTRTLKAGQSLEEPAEHNDTVERVEWVQA